MTIQIVTTDNIDTVRDSMLACDQREQLKPGCSTWRITYQPGNQAGQITIWPDTGRAAICFGGNSVWGHWCQDERMIITDEYDDQGRIIYNESGEQFSVNARLHDTLLANRDEAQCRFLNRLAQMQAASIDQHALSQIIEHCEKTAELLANQAAMSSGEALRNCNALTETFGNAARYLREITLLTNRF